MSVEELRAIVPPPASPKDTGSEQQWDALELTLNITFPGDFKAYISAYGSGGFGDFLWIYNPFDRHLNYVEEIRAMLWDYTTIRDEFPDDYPFDVYPMPGGLFPWGVTDNGDRFYWQTIGAPDAWPTVLYHTRASDYETYNLSMTRLVAMWLSGELQTEILATQVLEKRFTSVLWGAPGDSG